MLLWIGTYRSVLKPGKGQRCPMEPSCSAYGKSVIESRGAFEGLLATVDRLHRCGHEPGQYDRIIVDGRVRLVDRP